MKFKGSFLIVLFSISVLTVTAESTQWYEYEEGILASSSMEKPAFLEFYADWCAPCIAMEENTYPDPRVVSALRDFIAIKVDTQKRIDIETRYGIAYYPTVVLLDKNRKEVTRHIGYLGPEEMVVLLKDSRGKLPKESSGFEIIYLVLAIIPVLIFRRFIG